MAGRYKQLVQYGRESAHKSWAPEDHSSLGDFMRDSSHLRGLEQELISGTREKSALEIQPSLNSKRAACFSSSAGFFPWPRVFHQTRRFQRPEGFYHPPVFPVENTDRPMEFKISVNKSVKPKVCTFIQRLRIAKGSRGFGKEIHNLVLSLRNLWIFFIFVNWVSGPWTSFVEV